MTTQEQLRDEANRALLHDTVGTMRQTDARQMLQAASSTCSNEYIAVRNALMHALVRAAGRASQMSRSNS